MDDARDETKDDARHDHVDDDVTIYHNPHCSKSRGALSILREKGLDPLVVRYLEAPPRADEVVDLARRLGVRVHDLVRTEEDEYARAGITPESPDDEVARAVAAHPILLQRPIVLRGERAVVARPPERVLELL